MQSIRSSPGYRDGRGLLATLRENFAFNLTRLLQRAGMTQRALAKELGMSETMVSKWANRVAFPEETQLERLAKIFDVDYEELFRSPAAGPPEAVVNFIKEIAKSHGLIVTKKS